MRNIVFILLLTGSSITGVAQKNVVKATAFFFPIPTVFTFGGGYERLITDQFSIQVNYNYFAYEMVYMGFGGGIYQRIIPEVRYYFGPQTSFREQLFIGVFTELTRLHESSDWDYVESESYKGDTDGNMINPGILFGKNIRLGNRMHMEMFIGWKYKFISKTETHFDENGNKSLVPVKEQASGVRLGLNFAYSF